MTTTKTYWLHTLSPTHVGVGRGLGYIDLPIDRDGVTGWPIIRGSAFKGVWADHFGASDEARKKGDEQGEKLKAAFGIAGDNNDSIAGALIPTDAQLVALPIRSFHGTFAWCTSPLALQKLHRTLALAGETRLPQSPPSLDADTVHLPPGSLVAANNQVFLEDLDFTAKECPTAHGWADKIGNWVFPNDPTWQTQFQKRFAVIPDAAFDFLCETGTEVCTRVRIQDDTKTVATGALWMEESLPAESILMGIIRCDRRFSRNGQEQSTQNLMETFASGELTLQMGGKATIGRGQTRCIFTPITPASKG